jgi:hypothetical protein
MGSHGRYVSVLKPPSADETVTFHLRQVNVNESSFDIPVNLTTSMDVSDIALAIKNAFNTFFTANDIAYDGYPSFGSDGYPPLRLKAVVCDHIVNLWSEVGFQIQVTSDSTTVIGITDNPIFPTITEAEEIGALYGVGCMDLTIAAQVEFLKIGSAQVVRYLGGFKVAASTYLHEERGLYGLGYKLNYFPVLYFDQPIIRGPGVTLVGVPSQDRLADNDIEVDTQDGLVSFPDYGPYQRNVLDKNNYVKQTYVAGFANVPDICKQVAIQTLQFVKYNPAVKSLKQGAFTIEYRDLAAHELTFKTMLNQSLGR